MAKRVSIINFKGGVGKTTFAFHLGTGLARYHKARVLLVDMDHQSSLSVVCMGATRWEKAVGENKTVDEVFKQFVGHRTTLPGKEIVTSPAMRDQDYKLMDIVPSSLHLDDTEIDLTASHQGNAIQSEWNKRTLLCRWLEETGLDAEYDYIVFDCPPATKIVSQNAIAASHGFVLPVVPEAIMERGAPHLRELVRSGIDAKLCALKALGQPRPMFVDETKLVGVVVTRIKVAGRAASGYTDDHTRHLRSLGRVWKSHLLKPYIVDGTGVSEVLSEGAPVYDRDWNQNVGNRGIHTMYRKLVSAVKDRIDAL